MKKILIATIFISLIACTKQLNQENPNKLTVQQYWKTPEDARAGVNAIYHSFYNIGSWARWMYFRLDLTSDEGLSASPWVELADWTRFNYVNYNFWEGNNSTWVDTYQAIFRANQVLKYVPQISAFTDASEQKKILAQAKFLRAFHYYYLALLWENVPLVLEPLTDPSTKPKQNTLAEVWAQVEKDFTEAAADLPTQWDDANVGRPTKGSALGYLARVYMQQHKWADAKTALDYFINGEGKNIYALVDFKENFRATQENNKESIFEIQFSNANVGSAEGNIPSNAVGYNIAQFFAPRGIGWSDGQARYWLVNEFKKEKTVDNKFDERLRYSLFYKGLEADFSDKTYGKSWEWGASEAWFRKFQRDYYRNNEDYWSEVNRRVLRLADVYLMYAEVLNELDQTAAAYTYVNMVRSRAKLNTLATAYPAIGTDKAAFRNRLKMERALELCGESVRWADLKRWGDLDTQAGVDIIKQRDPDFNNFVVGKHNRLPIPQTEVLNSAGSIQQNPNY